MVFRLATTSALLGASVTATLIKQQTPPLGWNSYNYYGCSPNEDIIMSNAQGLVDLGLADLGYTVVTTDCGWPSTERDDQGRLQWNSALFPSGAEALGDYIHGLGLKFGLYSGGGYYQCGSEDIPASLGYEDIDSQSFSDWGGDSVKYDNCYAKDNVTMVDSTGDESTSPVRFQTMATALDNVDRGISYYICQWGLGENVGEWAPPIGNTFRISNDIYGAWRSVWRITNQAVPFWKHTTVGAYPDLDMLLVGLGALSPEEERFHMSMWALNKSPLTIGAPLATNSTAISTDSLSVVSNPEILAINQDALGQQARLLRRYTEEEWDVWAGNLSESRVVLGLANWRNESQSVSVDLASVLGIEVGEGIPARDVWAGEDVGPLTDSVLTAELAAHEMRVLVLETAGGGNVTAAALQPGEFYAAATDGLLGGSAEVVSCDGEGECEPTGSKVGNLLGTESTVRFEGVTAGSDGTRTLGVRFVNYDTAFDTAWDWGSNTRNMTIAVNGGQSKRWAFPISGGDWYESDVLMIEVEGFEEGEENVVVFGATGTYAPDLVGFEVYE